MSAIHDALKRAKPEPQVLVTVSKKKNAAGWLWALTLALFVVQAALYFRESTLRGRAETKLQQAYLQLNDERGKSLDMVKDRTLAEDRLTSLQKERDRALADKEALAKANQQVEFDNLAKEKKLSQMSKDLHKLEMEKLQLTEEIQALKSEPKI